MVSEDENGYYVPGELSRLIGEIHVRAVAKNGVSTTRKTKEAARDERSPAHGDEWKSRYTMEKMDTGFQALSTCVGYGRRVRR